MLKRKIENSLMEWKQNPSKKPLIIKGCRQCGKTRSVLDFAHNNYPNVVYLNFFEKPDYIRIFEGALDVETITMQMSVIIPGAKFVPHKTIIILDEIQEAPDARTALKFFREDGKYDVIATGSLLGVQGYGKTPKSIPVGSETIITMYPLDFEEFLWANGIEQPIFEKLRECFNKKIPVPEALHSRLHQLLLQYTIVGGMPEVVQEFVNTHLLDGVLRLQEGIVQSYRDDMVKYAASTDKGRIKECFDSIPKQLAKENKKFQYSLIEKKGSAAKFAGCLQWIEDAGIITRCYNLQITELPLDGNADNSVFKVYMNDVGLFVSMLEPGTQADILQGNLLGYKGAIFENLAASILHKMGRKLYYFRKDSGLEIDFVTRYQGKCTLIEVKAENGNAKSVKTILSHPEKYHVEQAIKFGNYNVGNTGNVLTLPLYMLMFLDQY